jgi:hypothetical protein
VAASSDLVEKGLGGDFALASSGLGHRGEPKLGRAESVIEARDGQVMGYAHAGSSGGAHGPFSKAVAKSVSHVDLVSWR